MPDAEIVRVLRLLHAAIQDVRDSLGHDDDGCDLVDWRNMYAADQALNLLEASLMYAADQALNLLEASLDIDGSRDEA